MAECFITKTIKIIEHAQDVKSKIYVMFCPYLSIFVNDIKLTPVLVPYQIFKYESECFGQ